MNKIICEGCIDQLIDWRGRQMDWKGGRSLRYLAKKVAPVESSLIPIGLPFNFLKYSAIELISPLR
jgi:hypothetical protein